MRRVKAGDEKGTLPCDVFSWRMVANRWECCSESMGDMRFAALNTGSRLCFDRLRPESSKAVMSLCGRCVVTESSTYMITYK